MISDLSLRAERLKAAWRFVATATERAMMGRGAAQRLEASRTERAKAAICRWVGRFKKVNRRARGEWSRNKE